MVTALMGCCENLIIIIIIIIIIIKNSNTSILSLEDSCPLYLAQSRCLVSIC